MRQRLYRLLEPREVGDKIAVFYHSALALSILFNLFFILYHPTDRVSSLLEAGTVWLFLADYLLHFCTADLHFRRGFRSFLRYPFAVEPILDILGVLPFFCAVPLSFKVFKSFKLLHTFRVLQILRGKSAGSFVTFL